MGLGRRVQQQHRPSLLTPRCWHHLSRRYSINGPYSLHFINFSFRNISCKDRSLLQKPFLSITSGPSFCLSSEEENNKLSQKFPNMETLVEPAGQNPADKEERSRVLGSDLGENGVNIVSSEGLVEGQKKDENRLIEAEISVKGTDESGRVCAEVSLSDGEPKMMSGKRGRKRGWRKSAGNEEKVDTGKGLVAQESEKNGVGKTSNGGGGDVELKSTRKSARRGGLKQSGQGVPGNAVQIDDDSKQVGEELLGDEEEEDEKGMIDEEHNFCVGDLVWGKIKSHPWWPGQIYRPSDASEAAKKYKRRNRLLVAYFGDGTFAWCYPSQLKPFQENFEELANQSNMKSFTKAVEAAVNEIGRCLDLEMTCCSVAVGDRPDKPVAMNAGINEGVAVPDTRLGGLSVLQCKPADFLAHLKYIAQVVSVNNMLDLLVLEHRLSGFYLAKGYHQLAVYHEPMEILVPDGTAVNELTHKNNVEARTEDIPRRRIMDDNLFHTTKQRSMTELMATKTSDSDDENGGNLFAGKGTISEKETVTTKNRRKSKHSEVRDANFLTEDLNTPAKQTPASRTRKKIKDAAGHHNDASEERTLTAKATLTPGNRRKKQISEVVKNDMADENNLTDVEVGNVNDAAEKLKDSDKQTMGRRTRKKIPEAVIGHEHDVTKEPALSDQKALDLKKMEKIKDFEVGNGKGTVKEIIAAGKQSTKRKKRKESMDSEHGNDSGVIENHDPPSKTAKKTTQRVPMVTGENKTSADENSDVSKQISPPEVPRKTKCTDPSVTGENKASVVENNVGGKSSIVKESRTDGQSALILKTPRKAKPTGLSVTVENKPFDVETEDLGSNDGSKSAVSFRERKKSKYLSPPYINSLFSPRDSRSEKSKFTSSSHERDNITGAGQFNIWPPHVRCSGKNLPQSNASGRSSPLLEKAVLKDRNVHEMLSDLRTAALDPLYLGMVQSDDVIEGFFSKFRGSTYRDEHEFMDRNKIFVDSGGMTVSFDTKADSSSKDTLKTGFQVSEGESESKQRKMEDEKMQGPKLKSKHAGGTADVQMDSNGDANVEKPVPVLLLTFVPEVLLPSKDELIATFSPCGALKESETKVIQDSCCAQVVFAKEADALEAYNNFENLTSFGSSVISYRLRYLLPASLASEDQHQPSIPSPIKESDTSAFPSNSSSQDVEAPSLASIRQNIEMANSMLEKSWDKLSVEVKTSLGDDIRSLLNKVTSMVGSSSS